METNGDAEGNLRDWSFETPTGVQQLSTQEVIARCESELRKAEYEIRGVRAEYEELGGVMVQERWWTARDRLTALTALLATAKAKLGIVLSDVESAALAAIKTKRYLIRDSETGRDLGVYAANSELEALDWFARAEGFASYAAAKECADDGIGLTATETSEPERKLTSAQVARM